MTDFTDKKINRLIIVGNGFDLAHGLETSFKDFLNYCCFEFLELFKTIRTNCHFKCEVINDDNLVKYLLKSREISRIEFYHHFSSILDNNLNRIVFYKLLGHYDKNIDYISLFKVFSTHCNWKLLIEDYINEFYIMKENPPSKDHVNFNSEPCLFYKNQFTNYLFHSLNFNDWGGIETDFYNVLLYIADIKTVFGIRDNYGRRNINDLNKQFDVVIRCLEKYLTMVSRNSGTKIPTISDHLSNKIKKIEIINKISTLFEKKHTIWDVVGEEKIATDHNTIDLNQTLILNFNYTSIFQQHYSQNENYKHIHIHGELNNKKNPIIFGYGDETDDSYQKLQDMNNNEYLKFAKSLHYQLTDNYRKLLNFLDSDYYQVYIWGHSCSISDRVLLNTIFEHNNCISIKPFYYDNGTQDNYFDLITNISRNFKDKKRFREIVLNKKNCTIL